MNYQGFSWLYLFYSPFLVAEKGFEPHDLRVMRKRKEKSQMQALQGFARIVSSSVTTPCRRQGKCWQRQNLGSSKRDLFFRGKMGLEATLWESQREKSPGKIRKSNKGKLGAMGQNSLIPGKYLGGSSKKEIRKKIRQLRKYSLRKNEGQFLWKLIRQKIFSKCQF